MIQKSVLFTAALSLFVLIASAPAAEIWQLSPYTGDPIGVDVLVQDDAMAETLRIIATVEPDGGNTVGDLRAIYFNVNGGAAGISEGMFSSPDVGSFEVCIGPGVTACGSMDTNLSGPTAGLFPTGSFDVGIEIGTSGIGGDDDYQMATFLFNYGALGLTPEDLGPFAARVTSVGTGDARGGSAKLFDDDGPGTVPDIPDEETPIPEPSAWTLFAAGLGLVSLARLRSRKH